MTGIGFDGCIKVGRMMALKKREEEEEEEEEQVGTNRDSFDYIFAIAIKFSKRVYNDQPRRIPLRSKSE